MNSTSILLQVGLAALYFGSGWLFKHLQAAPAGQPAGGVLQHILQEVEDQAVTFLRGAAARVLQQGIQATLSSQAPAPSTSVVAAPPQK